MLFWIKNQNKNRVLFDTDTYETMTVIPSEFTKIYSKNDIQLAHNYILNKDIFCAFCTDKANDGKSYNIFIYKGAKLYGIKSYSSIISSGYENMTIYETQDGDFDLFLNKTYGTDAFHTHLVNNNEFDVTPLDEDYFSTSNVIKIDTYSSHSIIRYSPTKETFLTAERLMMRYIEATDSYKLMEVNDSDDLIALRSQQEVFIKTVIVPKIINIIKRGVKVLQQRYKDFRYIRQRTTSDLLNYYCAEALQHEIAPVLKAPICFIHVKNRCISLHAITIDTRGSKLKSYTDVTIAEIMKCTDSLFR